MFTLSWDCNTFTGIFIILESCCRILPRYLTQIPLCTIRFLLQINRFSLHYLGNLHIILPLQSSPHANPQNPINSPLLSITLSWTNIYFLINNNHNSSQNFIVTLMTISTSHHTMAEGLVLFGESYISILAKLSSPHVTISSDWESYISIISSSCNETTYYGPCLRFFEHPHLDINSRSKFHEFYPFWKENILPHKVVLVEPKFSKAGGLCLYWLNQNQGESCYGWL